MKCLKKGRSTLCSAGICSRCSCYWLFGHMLQAQYLKSDKEAKTANSHWSFETNKNGDIVTLSLQFSLKCSIFNFPFIKRKSRALLVDFARVLCSSRCGPCALLQLIRITRLSLFSRHMIGSAQCYSYCHWPIVLSVKTLTKDCNRRYIRHVSYFYDRKVISL